MDTLFSLSLLQTYVPLCAVVVVAAAFVSSPPLLLLILLLFFWTGLFSQSCSTKHDDLRLLLLLTLPALPCFALGEFFSLLPVPSKQAERQKLATADSRIDRNHGRILGSLNISYYLVDLMLD